MHSGSTVSGPCHLGPQILPVWLLAAKVSLRQLNQQRRGRLGDRCQVVDSHQAVQLASRVPGQTMQPLVGLPLVPVQVTHRVEDDRSSADPGRWAGTIISARQLADAYGVTDTDGSKPDCWGYVAAYGWEREDGEGIAGFR